MNNYERYFGSVADAADFLLQLCNDDVCGPLDSVGPCVEFETCDECVIAWLLAEAEE